MDFFKSVFSADPDASNLSPQSGSPSQSPRKDEEDDDQVEEEPEKEQTSPNPNAKPNPLPFGGAGAWSFGGLIKTIASRSESVIETYRRDLDEFRSGLKKETEVIKEVASRAVRDLPGSLEVGASVAQESLESVGQAIDDFGGSVWRGTAEIISHGKEALLAADSDASSADPYSSDSGAQNPGSASKRYSRFEVQVLAIQNDPSTFAEEPEDGEDFKKWKVGFNLEEKEEEIEILCYENGTLEGFYEKLVPEVVDQDTFWSRYFYRVYKFKQAEDARANLVKRVISREEEEEELTWEVDDEEGEEEEEDREVIKKEEVKGENKVESEEEMKKEQTLENAEIAEEKRPAEEEKNPTEEANKEVIFEKNEKVDNLVDVSKDKSNGDDSNPKGEDKITQESKSELGGSSKDSDFSVVSSQPSVQEEDDLGWDEIEDLGEHDERRAGGNGGSPKKIDLRKRLSTAEEDEDLSWDIEDDDDVPTKP